MIQNLDYECVKYELLDRIHLLLLYLREYLSADKLLNFCMCVRACVRPLKLTCYYYVSVGGYG